jgi:hypothetical protein
MGMLLMNTLDHLTLALAVNSFNNPYEMASRCLADQTGDLKNTVTTVLCTQPIMCSLELGMKPKP